jgi:hypothetical protein
MRRGGVGGLRGGLGFLGMARLKFFSYRFVGFLGESLCFREFGLRFCVLTHGLIEAGEAPVDLHVTGSEVLGLLEIAEGCVAISGGGIEYA